jgi:hypothetical protein
MPCGGIYPIANHVARKQFDGNNEPNAHECYQCRALDIDPDTDLFVIEYDAFLHRRCLPAFLDSPEGETIMAHGHAILLPELPVDADVRQADILSRETAADRSRRR